MITGEIKSQIDRIWDAFWSGGISIRSKLSSRSLICFSFAVWMTCRHLKRTSRSGLIIPFEQREISRGHRRQRSFLRRICAGRVSENIAPAEMFIVVSEHVFPLLAHAGVGVGRGRGGGGGGGGGGARRSGGGVWAGRRARPWKKECVALGCPCGARLLLGWLWQKMMSLLSAWKCADEEESASTAAMFVGAGVAANHEFVQPVVDGGVDGPATSN